MTDKIIGKGQANYLYVMMVENRYIKIGICKGEHNVEKRRKSLQTGNPHKIEVIYYEERASAKDAEHYLHVRFGPKRAEGEWFDGVTLHEVRRELMMFHDQD